MLPMRKIVACLLFLSVIYADGLQIVPGIGLASPSLHVVVFEHTVHGSGGLVLNHATPILLKDLNMPRFSTCFGSHALYMGCDFTEEESNIAMGEMAPWYWLHDMDNLDGSFQLEGADGNLYMGRNLEEASRRINNGEQNTHFKFFWKAKTWKPRELEQQIEDSQWTIRPQNPLEALCA